MPDRRRHSEPERLPGILTSRHGHRPRPPTLREGTRFETGRRFHYSNVGYGVLGAIVAAIRGRPWDEVIADELLAPLKMTRTSTRPRTPAAQGFAVHPWADVLLPEPEHDAGAMAPAGQLWTTVTDLARWAIFLQGDGAGILDAETGDAAIEFANATSGMGGQLSHDLMKILAREEPHAIPEWVPHAVPDGVLDALGVWYWGPYAYALAATDAQLELRAPLGRGRESRFDPDGNGDWIGLDGYHVGEPLKIVRREDGAVSHLDIGSFIYTRQPYEPAAPVPGGVDPGGWRA